METPCIFRKKITSTKVRGSEVDFSTIESTSKKVRGNNVDFSTIEITSKNYVEMTCKFVRICSLTYQHNIHIKSKSIQRRVSLGNYFCKTLHLRSVSLQCLYFWVLIFICSSFFLLMNIFQTSNDQTKGIVRSLHQKNEKKKFFFVIAGIKPYISIAILWKK